jgi:hypothetical protein
LWCRDRRVAAAATTGEAAAVADGGAVVAFSNIIGLIVLAGVQPVRLADGWCWFVLREEYCWLVAGLF